MGLSRFSPLISFLYCFIAVLVGVYSEENARIFHDRASLLAFLSGVVLDPENTLKSWNSSGVHVCNWSGVRCNNGRDQVIELDLRSQALRGTISPAISNLSFLRVLDLSGNFFEGEIPAEIGALFRLQQLSLSSNLLRGKIPAELGLLRELVYLNLGSNQLVGEIPVSLFCNGSSTLEYVDFSNNSLSGEIPLKNCELKELRFLLLWSNRLVGHVPQALSNSTKLEWLDVESNLLSGELPSGIVQKMPNLQILYLSYNDFVSHDGNTNLEPFFASLVNCSNFQELELGGNNLGGEIPSIIGDLSTSLAQIHLDENLIYGPIPADISRLVNLTLLNLSSNLLNGSIPSELSPMGRLERVYFSNNSLSGEIPSAFGDIPHLGMIPSEVAGLRSLKLYLNLSSNHLQGPIPLELSKMDMLLAMDLSSNNLSGTIPTQLRSCIALEYLNLSGNVLQGPLPVSIGQLPYLQELDVSSNQLIGEIPQSLQASSTLKYLNFSFNNFSGNISNKGSFSSLTMDSFLGNVGLCGSIKGMPNCRRKHAYHLVLLPILLSIFATPILCIFGYPFMHKSGIRRPLAIFNGTDMEEGEQERKELKYPRITHRQLVEATGGFSSSSLIGSGRFGHVYKGVLRDNTRIAVKVLDSRIAAEISGSFKRECQVLKRTRHRNLIRIITICSKPDFKALVLPLMSNGCLERHLYPGRDLGHGLNLVQLVSICSDVAEGVAYLHHYSPVRGTSANDSTSYSSTDGLLCGSIGYIAPEYGLGKRASTQGDVYSFGVLLLEIVTGKRPTDVLFHDGSSLHEWVKSQYPNKLEPIVEQALTRATPPATPVNCSRIWRDAILELIELGLICTQYIPATRPSMLDVANEMVRLKQYLCNHSSQMIEEA
ncbi:unnamed protein product, partial [Vitis vinifera]